MAQRTESIYKIVADGLIKQLEEGQAPWQKPWDGFSALPYNASSGRGYRGMNVLNLMARSYGDPRWMTYNQARKDGFQVKKGEKGSPIVYWKTEEKIRAKDEDGKPLSDADGQPVYHNVQLERPRMYMNFVFNAEQIDGLPPLEIPKHEWEPVEKAEELLTNSGANIIHRPHNRAFYSPSEDIISLPEREQFHDAEGYYDTALHELGHWTGHDTRLNREFGIHGSEKYAREELRAEIASMLLSYEVGIKHDSTNHAAYVGSWIKILKDDPKEIFRAAKDAEKAVNYVMGRTQTVEQSQEVKAENTQKIARQAEVAQATPAENQGERTYLNVGYADKDEAKAIGAKWDRQKRQWYAPANLDKESFAKWVPDTQADSQAATRKEFAEVLKRIGCVVDGEHPIVDGKEHRIAVDGDKIGQESGTYTLGEIQGVLTGYAGNQLSGQQERWEKAQEINNSDKKNITQPSKEAGFIYLAVSYRERNKAKAAGAKWDASAKSWYVTKDADMSKVEKWLPDNQAESQTPAMPPREEFAVTLKSIGCIVDGEHPIMDGEHHRIAVDSDAPGQKSGFYVGHLDGRPAGYAINNRSGEEERWKSTGVEVAKTEAEQKAWQATCDARRAERAEALAQKHEETAQRVKDQLGGMQAVKVPTPYMLAKNINPQVGAYVAQNGTTCIPAQDADGKVWTMQYINEDGTKRFAQNGKKEGCFHIVGGAEAIREAKVLIVAEGYATAASISDALGVTTVAAFDAGNLAPVLKSLHQQYPDKALVVAGDDDRHLEASVGNIGRVKAEKAANTVGAKCVFPVFNKGEEGKGFTDFNDMAVKSAFGAEGVRRQLMPVIEKTLQEMKTKQQEQKRLEQVQQRTQSKRTQTIK
ncbi:MAG: zincin-like metallopeptidase domain-containing protein [Pseudomonadota bacterium]